MAKTKTSTGKCTSCGASTPRIGFTRSAAGVGIARAAYCDDCRCVGVPGLRIKCQQPQDNLLHKRCASCKGQWTAWLALCSLGSCKNKVMWNVNHGYPKSEAERRKCAGHAKMPAEALGTPAPESKPAPANTKAAR
jgi:hypothetical protein